MTNKPSEATTPQAERTLEQFRVHLAHMIQNYRCLAEKAQPYERHGDEECARATAFLKAFETERFEARAVAPVDTPDDELCQNCHRENPVWFAPNAVWNAVVTEISGILCPICFINRAERQGFRCTGWELVPELVDRPTDDKTPVGVGAPANLAPVETANFVQLLPGGMCFAHGRYEGYQCPQWPKCITDPQKQEYLAQAQTLNATTFGDAGEG